MAILQHTCSIVEHVQSSPTCWQLTLKADQIASIVKPGQFVHLLIPGFEEHILRRPFSVYQADCEHGCIKIMYRVVGEGTRCMTGLLPGTEIDILGPIGTGWSFDTKTSHALIVGAGVGAAPVFELAKFAKSQDIPTTVVLGAQTYDELVFERDYRKLGVELHCATDDGSYGIAGFCTNVSDDLLKQSFSVGQPFDYCAVCGPYPVMKIVASQCEKLGVTCQVSMEKRMACGIGACLSCVLDTQSGKKRSCVDGPVFNASEVKW